MDRFKAGQLFEQINGEKIKDICIDKFIDNGKSAGVYRGIKDGQYYAIKIFDTELIEKYGSEIQQDRLELELSLKDHKISNLVKILDGGKTNINSNEYFYLVMEYKEGKNLKKFIAENIINLCFIVEVAKILIDTTEKLFENNPPLVHRDIKPENIMVANDGEITLMDLGVLKPVGVDTKTDVENMQFIGTLRYASPEFLMRTEENSLNGWRALNIYQIGAVLHDLIMKKELFNGIELFTRLVFAINEETPSIITSEYNPELIQITRSMLSKNWRKRLEVAPIAKIKTILTNCLITQDDPKNYFNEIKTNSLSIQDKIKKNDDLYRSKEEKRKKREKIHGDIWKIIDNYFSQTLEIKELMNKIESSDVFSMDVYPYNVDMTRFKFYQMDGKLEYCFSGSFLILLMVQNDSNSIARISILGVIPSIHVNKKLQKPYELMYELFTKERKYPPPQIRITNPPGLNLNMRSIFDGIVEFGDDSLKNLINKEVSQLLNKIAEKMKPDVEETLERQKESLEKGRGLSTWKVSPGNIFIYSY